MRANAQRGSGKESEERRKRALRVAASHGQLCPAGGSGSITTAHMYVSVGMGCSPHSWAKVHASFNC